MARMNKAPRSVGRKARFQCGAKGGEVFVTFNAYVKDMRLTAEQAERWGQFLLRSADRARKQIVIIPDLRPEA